MAVRMSVGNVPRAVSGFSGDGMLMLHNFKYSKQVEAITSWNVESKRLHPGLERPGMMWRIVTASSEATIAGDIALNRWNVLRWIAEGNVDSRIGR